jgi:hypothetical protein
LLSKPGALDFVLTVLLAFYFLFLPSPRSVFLFIDYVNSLIVFSGRFWVATVIALSEIADPNIHGQRWALNQSHSQNRLNNQKKETQNCGIFAPITYHIPLISFNLCRQVRV